MVTVSLLAYGFASTINPKDLIPVFDARFETRLAKDQLTVALPEGRWAFVFDFGAIVFVGIPEEECARVVEAVLRLLPSEPHQPFTESFLLDVQPGQPIKVKFDRVIVPELDRGVVEIVAEVLAQSVAMDYYADDVAEIEKEMDRITAELRARGVIPQRVRSTLQFIGLCIATRNDVISTLALFDKPDATWENETLDRLWNGLRKMLELDDRYRALDAKLRMFQDNLVLIVDLARQRHTLWLELAVVLLIAGEMGIMVWQGLNAAGH